MGCTKTLDFAPSVSGAHLSFYWTMDEAGAANKLDSTVGLSWPLKAGTVAGAGLFSNGTLMDASAFGHHGLILVAFPAVQTTGSVGISFWFWMRINVYGDGTASSSATFAIQGFDNNPVTWGEVDLSFGTGPGNLQITMTLLNSDPFPSESTPTFSTNPGLGNWHMVACTFDAVHHAMKVYFDGVMVETAPTTLTFYQSPALTLEFENISAASGNTDWTLDELGLCLEGVLTQAQITSLFNGGAGVTWPNITPIVPYP